MKHHDKSLSYSDIVSQMNEKYDITEGRKLSKSTLQRYVAEKKIGVSPDKRGPSPTLPGEFWELLDAHTDITQLEGNAETKPRMLKAIIGASLLDTEFESLSVDKIYRKFRERYADTNAPTRSIEMEERRALWTTYPNVNRWFDGSKQCLVHYGYAEDKPQRVLDIFKGRPRPANIDGEF